MEFNIKLSMTLNDKSFMLIYNTLEPPYIMVQYNINGLVQDCSISNMLAIEILQTCTKPSICYIQQTMTDGALSTRVCTTTAPRWAMVCQHWFRWWLHMSGNKPLPEPLLFGETGGCFNNVSRALQNNLVKIYNARNIIYAEKVMAFSSKIPIHYHVFTLMLADP